MDNRERLRENYHSMRELIDVLDRKAQQEQFNAAMLRLSERANLPLMDWETLESKAYKTSDAVQIACILEHLSYVMSVITGGMESRDARKINLMMAGMLLDNAEQQISSSNLLTTHITEHCKSITLKMFIYKEKGWYKKPKSLAETKMAVMGLCQAEDFRDFDGYGDCVQKWHDLEDELIAWIDQTNKSSQKSPKPKQLSA